MSLWSRLLSFKLKIISRDSNKINEKWKEDLLSLYIVRNSDGICLFSHHFQIGLMSQIENQLIGMGFTAISKMMREVVDRSAQLTLMDLGSKIVLIEERVNILAILVVVNNLPFYRVKLEELADYFEKLFELQQQISLKTYVCLEDYALTSELVSLIFSEQSINILDMIPLIFKTIQRNDRRLSKSKLFPSKFNGSKKSGDKFNKIPKEGIEPLNQTQNQKI